jgi:hypothetical protein
MAILELVGDVALPRMAPIRQIFRDNALQDVEGALREEIGRPEIVATLKPGARIAVAVGSRGLADLPLLVRTIVHELKGLGTQPFIVPSMGSHGGATSEGQIGVLRALGVTEDSAGCAIRSSMETVVIGTLPNGLPVPMDRNALEADGIVVLNRVKAHTSFSGPVESGLMKMVAIGLGKQKGADACHSQGYAHMARNVIDMAQYKLEHAPFLFGIATIENGYDRICKVSAVLPSSMHEEEIELLRESKRNMPSILFTPIDVLVVDEMGKEFSGTGIDPNITGRAATPYVNTTQSVSKMVVLDLTERSHGNAAGIGLADVCTRRLFEKLDYEATYANVITSTVLLGAKIPVMMPNDRMAIQTAVKTCNATDPGHVRLVRLPNTLHLEHIEISEAMLEEAGRHSGVEILGGARDWTFDAEGNLRAS